MYAVTQDYKNNIYGDSSRIYSRVTFDISPVNIESDTPTITTTSEFAVSQKSQLTNNVRQQTYKLATWEQDRVKLDGSWTFPSASTGDWKEVGWVSDVIATVNKDIVRSYYSSYPPAIFYGTEYQTITMTYANSYTSAGLTVTFNPLEGEYATEFKITAKDSANNVIYTTTVTNNTLVQYKLIQTLTNFRTIEVELRKWSHASHRPRVAEIDAGVVLVYTNDELIRMASTEEMDPISSTLVIPEFEFTIDNSAKTFDILNPSGIYSSLQQRQRIVPELGLDLTTRTEWVPLGVYYLSEWRSDAGSLTATFRGRSKIDLLDLTNYSESVAQVSYSIYDMAVDVLTAAGITGYSIDTALQSISTNGLVESKTCREVLQLVAIAGQATIYVTRDDVLTIKQTRASTSTDYIDFDAMIEEPQIQQFKQVQSVSVVYYTDLTTTGGTSTVTDSAVTNGEIIVLEGNTLINNSTTATNVANWLRNRRNERNLFTIDYRGNPATELGDLVQIENAYATEKYIYVSKIEMNYEGYLNSKIEGRAT